MNEPTIGIDRRKQTRKKISESNAVLIDGKISRQFFPIKISSVSSNGITVTSAQQFFIDTERTLRLKMVEVQLRCVWSNAHSNSGDYTSGWELVQFKKNISRFQYWCNSLSIHSNDRRQRIRRATNETHTDGMRRRLRRKEDVFKGFSLLASINDQEYRRVSFRRQEEALLSTQSNSANRDSRRMNDRRATAPLNRISGSGLGRSISKSFSALIDLFAVFFPQSIRTMIYGDGSFAFITHPRDTQDIQRMFPFARMFSDKVINFWLRHMWPVHGTRIENIRGMDGKTSNGWLIFCPLTAKQMISNRSLAREKVIDTVRFAERLGAKIAGLGAFTSIVTSDGKDVCDKVSIGITTGNALSASVAIQNVVQACKLRGIKLKDLTVAIVGAGGNVGSACARAFYGEVQKLILVDINPRSLSACVEEMHGRTTEVQCSQNTEPIIHADVVIAVTNAPGAVVKSIDLKKSAIAIDCAQPKNVSEKVPNERPDVLVIESAVVELPNIKCDFDLGVGAKEALGCMAETIVLDGIGWHEKFSIGKLSVKQTRDIMAMAKILGIKVGYFRNSKGYVDEKLIRAFNTTTNGIQ